MATGRIPTTANSPLTAKGDLFTFSTGSAKLAVGSNGDTLVADSSATTGLRWQGDYAAGKNKIINGDFGVWQRGTSISATNTYAYMADRWQSVCDGAITGARIAFTPGTAPVAGYEGKYHLRYTKTSGTYWQIMQNIEDVQTYAGQTVTISFWAKVDTAQTVYIQLTQNFGSGGSTAVTTAATSQALTTSWVRYTKTITLPSITGKTIGASNCLILEIGILPTAGNIVFDIWGVQVEAGSTATAFQTATGTIQGELAACQRYFQREDESQKSIGAGAYYSTTQAWIPYFLKQTMRVAPTVTFDGTGTVTVYDAGSARASTAMTTDAISPRVVEIKPTTSSTTAGRGVFARISGSGNFINFDAEI